MKYECICKLTFHSFCSLWRLQRPSSQYKIKLGDAYKYKSAEMCYVHFNRAHQAVSFSLAIQQDECTSTFLFQDVRYFLSVLSCHRQMHKMPFWNIGCESLCSCFYGGSSVVKFRQRAYLKTSTSPAFYWVKTKQISVFSVLRHESRGSFANIHMWQVARGLFAWFRHQH